MGRLDAQDAAVGRAAGVGVALQRLRHEVQGLGWQLLGVGSGFWRVAAGCLERFVGDAADTLERRNLRSDQRDTGRWGGRIVRGVGGRLVRAVRWCEPRARAWRRLAVRIDDALLARGTRPAPQAGQAGSRPAAGTTSPGSTHVVP